MSESHSMAMLFLAAGASRRMGRPKALLPWHGKTVIAHHLQTLEKVGGITPWVVTSPNDAALQKELNSIGWPAEQRTVNPVAPECDMMESIGCGVRSVLKSSTPFPTLGIALLDQVLTRPETFQCLEKSARVHPDLILQPAYEGRRGHPIILPRTIAEQLVKTASETLRDFLEQHPHLRETVEVPDAGVLRDMDTPEAYQEQLLTP